MKHAQFWQSVLPRTWFYAEHLTHSANQLLRRLGAGAAGVVVAGSAIALLSPRDWRGVMTGALLAWGVAIIVWAASSYKREQASLGAELRRAAELDVLHTRLNEIAVHVGARVLDIDTELEPAIAARTERLAHFSGLDEFR